MTLSEEDAGVEIRQVPRSDAGRYYADGWDFLGLVPYPADPSDDYAFERWLESRDDVIVIRAEV